jgi:hypothetical protein
MIEPRISSVGKFGSDFVLMGSGGAPGLGYSMLVSSDLSFPISAWIVVTGNKFDNNGNFSFTNTLSGSNAVYRLRVP